MKYSDFLDNQVYLFTEEKTVQESEAQMIKDICGSLKTPINCFNLSIIDSNYDYDTYYFEDEETSYCIKISLDSNCFFLKNEIKNLKKINELIRPKYIADGIHNISSEILYLITSYEHAIPLKGNFDKYQSFDFDSLFDSYLLFQESKKIKNSQKNYYLNFLKHHNIKKIFPDYAVDYIDSDENKKQIIKIISEIKFELKTLSESFIDDEKFNCHGGLSLSTIIERDGCFKFINFDHSFSGHCFFDLADMIIELRIPQEKDFFVLKKFCEKMNIEYDKRSIEIYEKCYDICLRKKIINVSFCYLAEIFIFESERKQKIYNLCSRFSGFFDRFLKIDIFKENKDYIYKIITEPIFNK
jgi:hypothetical protein